MCRHCGNYTDTPQHEYACTMTALDMCNHYINARNRMKIGSEFWQLWNDMSALWWEVACALEDSKK